MFDCARVPGTEGLDWSVSHAKVGDTSGDGHIVVLRNGHCWRVDVARDGHILSTAELETSVATSAFRDYCSDVILARLNKSSLHRRQNYPPLAR